VTFDEYIADCEAKRDALRLRLLLVAHTKLSSKVRNERIRVITAEAKALRAEMVAVLSASQKRP
jgi:hypothetical protein